MNPYITKEIFKQARLGWILEELGHNFRRYFSARNPGHHKIISGIVDPEWQVGASTDDCQRRLIPAYFSLVYAHNIAGLVIATSKRWGVGLRFTNITIPNAALILSANLTLTCSVARGGTPCNTRISAEKHDSAPTFINDAAVFDARYANHTDAVVDWDNIPAWLLDVEYTSPELKTVIQEIVDRPGWASGQDLVLFWEDFDDRSVNDLSDRLGYSWNNDPNKAPKLEITYSVVVAPTVTTQDATDPCAGVGTLHGTITDNGGENCDERGFEWGLVSGGPYPNSWTETDSYGVGAFSHTFTDFPPGTLIYYRAKAHNSAGWGYGGEKSFTTCEAPPPPPGARKPKIELRLSDVEPPAADPPRTIYRDIYQLPDPVLLGITIRYYNYDDVGLYFRITGEAPGYTFTPVDLGLLASGANAYENLDEFASRAKPAAAVTESIQLILRAYTDAGYTNLKWTYQRTVTIVIIDSNDSSWTQDELDNFDDGTIQGWAVAAEVGVNPTIAVADDYVLSAPYSLKTECENPTPGSSTEVRYRTYKSFSTPNRNQIYAIIDLRLHYRNVYRAATWTKNLQAQRNGAVLVFIGEPYDTTFAHYIPAQKWMRIVVPLPKNVAVEIRVVYSVLHQSTGTGSESHGTLWLDDFKIVSK